VTDLNTGIGADIKAILTQARSNSARAINTAMVEAYWLIGRRIVEEEQAGASKATYGEALLKSLSRELTTTLGKGFSYPNLRNFRQFYLTYPDGTKCYALRSNLGWTHHRLIMRVDSPQARDYYITQSAQQNWSSRTLERQIQTNTYQRLLSTQRQDSATGTTEVAPPDPISSLIKDPYVLEFLQLPEQPGLRESELESAIISQLQAFLLEMGSGFSFVARQMRISTETSHFYM